mmetsp:Transcript_55490/g.130952  ORF Transcript_55490/g.130952 Transcript_55490/m.130952 type:complete len:112 (-) Transcript_55490:463-798(-)
MTALDVFDFRGDINTLDGAFNANNNPTFRVHLRVQQRTGRKYLTIMEGLPDEFDAKKILKALKKISASNGCIVDYDGKSIIQLQGDQRQLITDFLTTEGICTRDQLIIHGF